MKEDRKFYRQLRSCGVPFVDAHIMARKVAKGKSMLAFYDIASKANWSKPGKSNYKWDEFDEELHSYSSLILPNGDYLIDYSHGGLYVHDRLPF